MNSKYNNGKDLRPTPAFFIIGDDGWESVICPQCGATAGAHIMCIDLDHPMRCPPAAKPTREEALAWFAAGPPVPGDGILAWDNSDHPEDNEDEDDPMYQPREVCGEETPDGPCPLPWPHPQNAFPDEPGYENGYSPPIEEMEKVMRERLYGEDKENPVANLSDWQPFEDQFTGEILYKPKQQPNKLTELVKEVREALRQPSTPMKIDGPHVRVGREKPLKKKLHSNDVSLIPKSTLEYFTKPETDRVAPASPHFDTEQSANDATTRCNDCRGSGIVADPLTEYAAMACMRCKGLGYLKQAVHCEKCGLQLAPKNEHPFGACQTKTHEFMGQTVPCGNLGNECCQKTRGIQPTLPAPKQVCTTCGTACGACYARQVEEENKDRS